MESEKIIKYMRAKQLAEYFGISLSTVWRYAKEGKIKPIKISGGVTVFDVEAIKNDLIYTKQ
jgi:excisionase family DNA binding protein